MSIFAKYGYSFYCLLWEPQPYPAGGWAHGIRNVKSPEAGMVTFGKLTQPLAAGTKQTWNEWSPRR
jgi:hypothetical protein